jgi:hypothetical protein
MSNILSFCPTFHTCSLLTFIGACQGPQMKVSEKNDRCTVSFFLVWTYELWVGPQQLQDVYYTTGALCKCGYSPGTAVSQHFPKYYKSIKTDLL